MPGGFEKKGKEKKETRKRTQRGKETQNKIVQWNMERKKLPEICKEGLVVPVVKKTKDRKLKFIGEWIESRYYISYMYLTP